MVAGAGVHEGFANELYQSIQIMCPPCPYFASFHRMFLSDCPESIPARIVRRAGSYVNRLYKEVPDEHLLSQAVPNRSDRRSMGFFGAPAAGLRGSDSSWPEA